MGHKDIKMTMRYSHLSNAHLQEAVNVLDGMVGAEPPQRTKNKTRTNGKGLPSVIRREALTV